MLVAIVSLAVMGALFGMILGIAGKKFAVEIDPKIESLLQILPGGNCGACGFPGCAGFAEAVVEGTTKPTACSPGGASLYEKIAAIMGTEVSDYEERKVARVLCQGGLGNARLLYHYHGIMDCHFAMASFKGPKACNWGCIRLGSCSQVCPFDAIQMGADRLPVVDFYRCTGCGRCVQECPQNIIKLIGVSHQVHVRCVNTDKGKDARSACSVACIKCGLCVKNCPEGAVQLRESGSGSVAVIDYDKCTNCGICASKCPTGAIEKSVQLSDDLILDIPKPVQSGCPHCNACITA